MGSLSLSSLFLILIHTFNPLRASKNGACYSEDILTNREMKTKRESFTGLRDMLLGVHYSCLCGEKLPIYLHQHFFHRVLFYLKLSFSLILSCSVCIESSNDLHNPLLLALFFSPPISRYFSPINFCVKKIIAQLK